MNELNPNCPGATADEAALLRDLGMRVRASRTALGMPRRELAEVSGVSARYLAQLEAGEGNISIRLLSRVARALDVPLEVLLVQQGPDDQHAFLAAWKAAGPGARAGAMERLRASAGRAGRVCLLGVRGVGKSTLGRLAGDALGVRFVNLNTELETLSGMPLAEMKVLIGPDACRAMELGVIDQVTRKSGHIILVACENIQANPPAYSRILRDYRSVWVHADTPDTVDKLGDPGTATVGQPLDLDIAASKAGFAQAEAVLAIGGRPISEAVQELVQIIQTRAFMEKR